MPVPTGTAQLYRGSSREPDQTTGFSLLLRQLHLIPGITKGWFDPTLSCVIGGLGLRACAGPNPPPIEAANR